MPHKLTNPALAPELEMVITGATVLALLWYVDGSKPPATTGTFPQMASLVRSGVPLFGMITSPKRFEPEICLAFWLFSEHKRYFNFLCNQIFTEFNFPCGSP